jgi:hypothetical protein
VSEYVVRPSNVGAFDDPGAYQRLQPLRQQRRRHLRHAAPQVVEVAAARQQFAHDEHGPALVEEFHGLGNRTELAITRHLRTSAR